MRSSLLFLTALCLPTLALAAPPDWAQVLGPPQGAVPPPRAALPASVQILTFHKNTAASDVPWESDLTKALAQAKAENRPVLVTMRCLPCKSCSDFDKDVLEGGPDLDPLLLQFVTVRLTSAKDVDLDLLPMAGFQDLDTSWWGWLLSPEGRLYGVFGGRDVNGDAGRTSKKALVTTLNRVLAHHYDPRRPQWDLDGPAPKVAATPTTPTALPGYDNWLATGHKRREVTTQNCIHCHQVQEIFHQTALDAKAFDKRRDLDVWPLPENVGVTLERDDGLLIKAVKDNSPAARAGLKPGDRLAATEPTANNAAADAPKAPSNGALSRTPPAAQHPRRLFSQADFRAALHRAPMTGPATLTFVYLRDGQPRTATLDLPDGWRKTNNTWRISSSEGVFGASPGFWANDAARHRAARNIPDGTMAVQPFFPGGPKATDADRGPAYAAGLRPNDVVTAVNGQSPNLAGRPWIIWFRLNHEPGDQITLTAVDPQGRSRPITYKVKKDF